MSGVAWALFLVIAIPALAFGVWQLLQEAMVRIDSGSVGLLIVRGLATDRVLTPGVHFVWPFRRMMIQGYPLRELTYLATDDALVEETDYAGPQIRAVLGDRTEVSVEYTLRFRIRPDGLTIVHDRVGPDGIKRLVRDESRRIIADELRLEKYSFGHAFGSLRDALERALTERLTEALLADGFDVVTFHLRRLGLGVIGDTIEATVRAEAELDLERANAAVRALRLHNEAATNEQLSATLTDAVLAYRRIELGREALRRWDGRIVANDTIAAALLSGPLSAPLSTTPAAPPPNGVQDSGTETPQDEGGL